MRLFWRENYINLCKECRQKFDIPCRTRQPSAGSGHPCRIRNNAVLNEIGAQRSRISFSLAAAASSILLVSSLTSGTADAFRNDLHAALFFESTVRAEDGRETSVHQPSPRLGVILEIGVPEGRRALADQVLEESALLAASRGRRRP